MSSASFYFICVFGLRGVMSLILGPDNGVCIDTPRIAQHVLSLFLSLSLMSEAACVCLGHNIALVRT